MTFKSALLGGILLWFAVVGVPCSANTTTDPVAQEGTSNQVMVAMYNLSPSDWQNEVKSLFQTSVATVLSQYCRQNTATCGLSAWQQTYVFSMDLVVQSTTEVEDASLKQLSVHFYVKFNSVVTSTANATTSTTYVVNGNALQAAVMENREQISEDIGPSIVQIGNAAYSPLPTTTLNIVLSLIGALIVIVLIFVWIGLYCWKKRSDKEQKRLERKKKREMTMTRVSGSQGAKVHPIQYEKKSEKKKKVKPTLLEDDVPGPPTYQNPSRTAANGDAKHVTSSHSGYDSGEPGRGTVTPSMNYFREEEDDSGLRSMETLPKATAVFKASDVSQSYHTEIDGSEKKRHKKKSKHRRNSRQEDERGDNAERRGTDTEDSSPPGYPDNSRVDMRMY